MHLNINVKVGVGRENLNKHRIEKKAIIMWI